MIDNNFCEYLEFEITKSLSNSINPQTRGFWCDGIIMPKIEKVNLQKNINDNRQIELTAFLGVDGQDQYKMIIYFGNKSLSKNAKGLELKQCVPENDNNWIQINTDKREIIIRLQ
jgi:hypothetical protein